MAVESECERILKFSVRIPNSFLKALADIQDHPNRRLSVAPDDLFAYQRHITNRTAFDFALNYFHLVGRVVSLPNGQICTHPAIIPKIIAKVVMAPMTPFTAGLRPFPLSL